MKIMTTLGGELAMKLKKHGFQKGKILDAGCGFGASLTEIVRAFPETEAVGVDLAEPLLERARCLSDEKNLSDRISFEKRSVEELPYDDQSFDVVINIFMLHIVENPAAMLNEIERVLKPTGHLLIKDLRRTWLGRLARDLRKAYTLEESQILIECSKLREGRFAKGLWWWEFESHPIGS
jgi:ubiquinone/menaquinone biosynthesis C-methylase UbiE